ncbi:MAG: hypothetical protein HY547_06510, partial [Elusimicrobia bacterium]|nr:hypothetical protein [Elusimicrobiota bacterium]
MNFLLLFPISKKINSAVFVVELFFFSGGVWAATITHTSQADFSSGTYAGWGVDAGAGGEITLGYGGAEILPGFSTTTALPAVRQLHAMSLWNGRLYVAGGTNSSGLQSTVYSAPLNSDGTVGSWTTETNSLPAARYGHAMSAW